MLKETIKNMKTEYQVTKKDLFDLFCLVVIFLTAAHLEVILQEVLKMYRTYIAIYDTGHDYGEFEYTSIYRNNSHMNKREALNTMHRKYGKISYSWKIINTFLSK